MSRLYYFASDSTLEEQPNPFLRRLTVKQAREEGLKLGDGSGLDDSVSLLFCETEEQMDHPNMFSFRKEEYTEAIGTDKPYCAVLEWDEQEQYLGVVLAYIQKQLEHMQELEFWKVWLGDGNIPATAKRSLCNLSDLTVEQLRNFVQCHDDGSCLVIVR